MKKLIWIFSLVVTLFTFFSTAYAQDLTKPDTLSYSEASSILDSILTELEVEKPKNEKILNANKLKLKESYEKLERIKPKNDSDLFGGPSSIQPSLAVAIAEASIATAEREVKITERRKTKIERNIRLLPKVMSCYAATDAANILTALADKKKPEELNIFNTGCYDIGVLEAYFKSNQSAEATVEWLLK